MTLDEIEQTGYWSNEEYFGYMKETGNWGEAGDLGITGKPCDRCENDELGSWKVEVYFDFVEKGSKGYTVVSEFEICTLCMFELYGAKHSKETMAA